MSSAVSLSIKIQDVDRYDGVETFLNDKGHRRNKSKTNLHNASIIINFEIIVFLIFSINSILREI